MEQRSKIRVGVLVLDPLRLLGLQTILQEVEDVEIVQARLNSIDGELAALFVDGSAYADRLLPLVGSVRRERPEVKVLVIGLTLGAEQVQELIGAGAKAYLPENVSEAEVRTALREVLDGSVWAPRKVLARLIDAAVPEALAGTPAKPVQKLAEIITPREGEVLHLLTEGKSNREIAEALHIDEVTVKAHLGRLLRKAGASNRVELTLKALDEQGQGFSGQKYV